MRSLLGWRTVYWSCAGLILAGIVHIVAVFAAPLVGARSGWHDLVTSLPLHQMKVLPAPKPSGMHLPFMMPDVSTALCRYDLRAGSLEVSAHLIDAASVTLFTDAGESYSALTSADLPSSRLEMTVQPPLVKPMIEQLQALFMRPRSAQGTQRSTGLAIRSPSWQGVVLVRVPILGAAYRAETEAALQRAACRFVAQPTR